MADIGSLLLPDINLMQGYEQSFQRQQALKQYIVQKSDKDEEKYYKDNTFGLDDALGAVQGQQQAMIGKQNEYMAKVQKAYADMKHGAMFRLDPKKSAELQMERVKLEADQAQRIYAIKKLNSAQTVINKPGFGLTHDADYTNSWVKQLQGGKLPEGEPIQALAPDLNKVTTDVLKPFGKLDSSQDVVLSAGRGGSKVMTQKYNSILAGGQPIDPKTYDQIAHQKASQELMNNPVWRYTAQANFEQEAKKNPAIAKQFEQFGDNAGIMYGLSVQNDLIKNATGLKTDIKAKTYKPDKPEKETQAEKRANPQADQYGNIHLADHKITAHIPSLDVNGKPKTILNTTTKKQDIINNDVEVVSHNTKNNTFVVREPVKTIIKVGDKDLIDNSKTKEVVISDPVRVAKIKKDMADEGIALPDYKIDNTTPQPTKAHKGNPLAPR